jgi:hypothetical protein
MSTLPSAQARIIALDANEAKSEAQRELLYERRPVLGEEHPKTLPSAHSVFLLSTHWTHVEEWILPPPRLASDPPTLA